MSDIYYLKMKILPEPITFNWDKGNIDKNEKKHRVSRKEIEEPFQNQPIYIFEDEKHTTNSEKRRGIYGFTNNGRLLSLVFTLRNNCVRIITARDMSKKERSSYEKIKIDTKI